MGKMSECQKLCIKCLEEKSVDLFKQSKYICRTCVAIGKQERSGKQVCDTCGRMLPAVAFAVNSSVCRSCRNATGINRDVKECKSCGEYLPPSEFGKNKRRSDGLQSICKACKSVKDKEYYKTKKDRQITVTNQICIGCLVDKPAKAFYKQPKLQSGLQSRCIDCMKRISREGRNVDG